MIRKRPYVIRHDRWLIPSAIVITNLVLAGWGDVPSVFESWVPLLYACSSTLLFESARRAGQAGTAVIVLMFEMAFIPYAGLAIHSGIWQSNLFVRPDSVIEGLGLVQLFLAVLVVGALATGRTARGLLRKPSPAAGLRRVDLLATAIVVVFVSVMTLLMGDWSTYGLGATDAESVDFKWDLFVDPVLMGGAMVSIEETARAWESSGGRWRRIGLPLLAVSSLFFLLFVRQVRRHMLGALLLGALQISMRPSALRVLTSVRRLSLGLGVMVVVGLLAQAGSIAWRASATEDVTGDPVERISDTWQRMDTVNHQNLGENIQARLTYLWVDSASVQHQQAMAGALDLATMLINTVVTATPKMLFPGKYRYPMMECETAFQQVGIANEDLACTPESEGFLASGLAGVALVALPFGFFCGFASILLRRGTVLGVAAATFVLMPFMEIETSAFPWVYSMRYCLVLIGFMLLVRWGIKFVSGLRGPVSNRSMETP